MPIPDLPVEVSLLVFKHLGTCRVFREITQMRSVWLELLDVQVSQRKIPIPGLGGRDLAQLSAQELEMCVADALQLRKNWTAASPQPIRRQTFGNGLPGPSQVVSVQFIPGRGARWLLSLTIATGGSWERTVQCWDTLPEVPFCIARRTLSGLRGLRVNTDASHPGVLAVATSRQGPESRECNDFTSPQGFFAVQILNDVNEVLHAFTGSKILTKFDDQRIRLRTLQNPNVAVELRIVEQQECLDSLISDEYAVIMRVQALEIYALASLQAPVLEPISTHSFQWRIDSASIAYQPSLNSDITQHNLPYVPRPLLVQSFASPIRLFARWDMVLGRYGTALWIDSHTEDYFVDAHVVEGQRLAGAMLGLTEGNNEEEQIDLRELAASSHATTVYDLRENDRWIKIAVDDEEGKIALGMADGDISLLEYI
ncbi:F-box domain-containing protein [Mycena kentingensis (nom. inval.)]|nr:F-box domain-containing protein [Mycena kentingensis (nom. inval.)]